MVVTCPNCRARYAVDPLKIGPQGRTVQCARCDHRWFEKADVPAPSAAPAASAEWPASAAATGSIESSTPAAAAQPAQTAAAEDQPGGLSPAGPPEPAPEVVVRPTTRGAALPAVIPHKRRFGWGRAAAAVVLLMVVIGAALYAFRDHVEALVQQVRASAPADAAATSPPPPPPAPRAPAVPAAPARARIEIDLSSSKIEVVDGRYVVRGQLINNGTAPGSTSVLKVTFKRNEEVLGERSFPMVEGPLPPGGRASFSQTLDDPPTGTTEIVPVVE